MTSKHQTPPRVDERDSSIHDKPSLVVFDPGLRRRVNHHYNVSLAYSKAFERDFSVVWLTHRSFDPQLARYPFDPSIRHRTRPRSRVARGLNATLDRRAFLRAGYSREQVGLAVDKASGCVPVHARDLLEAERYLDDHGQLLIHSATPALVESLLFWLTVRQGKPNVRVHLRLMFDDESDTRGPHSLPRLLERLRQHENVLVYAEMPSLARWIEGSYGRPVPVALYNGNAGIVDVPRNLGGRPTVGFLGSAREEKGIRRVPAILDHLRHLGPPCDAMIQSFVRPRKNVRQRALWNDVLSRQSDTMAISIVEEHPELRVHWERMMSCSVLVLPYDPQRYRRRGSGIALEAAAAGVPYVASAGTSLCDFLEGGNGEAATDDRDFAEKISKILRNYPTYQDAARRLTKSVRGRLANDPIVRALQPVPSRWPVETVG